MIRERDLKHDLKYYTELKQGILKLENDLRDVQYQLERVISGGVVKVSHDQPKEKKVNYYLYETKAKLEADLIYLKNRLKKVDDFVFFLDEPYKSVVRDKYIYGFSYEKVAIRNNFSGTAIYKIIDTKIRKYIKNEEMKFHL
mgnify:CR=1 FL=1